MVAVYRADHATNTASSGSARRRRPPSGTRGTASATGRCGAGGRTGGSSPRSPTSPRAGRSTSVVARAPTRSGSLGAAGRSPRSTSPMSPYAGRGRPPSWPASRSSGSAATPSQTPFPARSFDLVSLQYPALPKAAGEAAVRTLLDTVRPGGLLLAVYHDLDDEHREHMKSRGVDPADYVGADDLVRLLGDDFTRRAARGRAARSTRRPAPRTSPTSSSAPGARPARSSESS